MSETATKATAPAVKVKAETPPKPMLLVLDTTAINEPRIHEQTVEGVIKPFTFERGKPLPLPYEIAAKFLKHDAFKLMNDKGEIIAWKRRPKQPDELGAGERIRLSEDETIARFDELSNQALLGRCVELPGGEVFTIGKDRPERADMIAFLVKAAKEKRAATTSKDKDVGEGEFVPEAEIEDDNEIAA